MPCLRVIEPATMTHIDKMDIFHQIGQIIPQLHKRQIVHGDIKLSNMLLDGRTLKLCHLGTSAWMEETKSWIAKGPSGIAVRSLVEWVKSYENSK